MEIEEKAKEIARHPESRSLDKYKLNNNGNYRYFTLHHLRISYRIVKEGIIISSVRHDKQKPRYY
jgi:plasmid stabilization system protein ParE